jgi:ABC-type nitrate/sulfonate/bicarbonate transport system substrate-binding protein
MAAREIRSPADLANRRIGVLGTAGATAAAVQAILERAGVKAELVPLGTYEAVFAALAAGRVHAGWLPIELAFKGRASSGWNAFEGARLALPGGYATTRRAIAAQRGVIETLVQGLVAAIHYFKADAEGATKLLQRRLGVERAVAAELQAFYAPLLRPAPQPSIFFGLAGLRETLKTRHPSAQRLQAADLVDASFVEAMVRDGTIAKLYQTR